MGLDLRAAQPLSLCPSCKPQERGDPPPHQAKSSTQQPTESEEASILLAHCKQKSLTLNGNQSPLASFPNASDDNE